MICPVCQCELFEGLDFDSSDTQGIEEYTKKQRSGQKEIDEVVLMSKCRDHQFHAECLEAQLGDKGFLSCSICMVTYGVIMGDMPPGLMQWSLTNQTCKGETIGTKTWEIWYEFPDGVNPATGKSYYSDSRVCFVPDSHEGREVLALLVKAFRRRLTFTVGYSVVRGRDNCIVWNGIHHKTNTNRGSTHYGYPDSTYFNRVK